MGDLSSELLLPDTEVVRQSFLSWMFHALGPFYALVIPLAGLVVFVGACLVVARSRRPAVIAAYLVFVPIPFLIGIYGSLNGLVTGLHMVSGSSGTPHLSEICMGSSYMLFSSLLGLLVTLPAYLVTAIGLFVRTACPQQASN